ncbi:MAG: peptide deformylase, partial [Bacillota bacterium]|nr:peptide deformylase [Bacillota bacterium]
QQEHTFEGFHARVMCHENDHLNGILYSDKAENLFHLEEQEDDGQQK